MPAVIQPEMGHETPGELRQVSGALRLVVAVHGTPTQKENVHASYISTYTRKDTLVPMGGRGGFGNNSL